MKAPTHKWVGAQTGYSIAAISRFRTAARPPTFEAMERFERAFGWPICDQVVRRGLGDWHDALNEVIARAATSDEEDEENDVSV